MCACVHIIKFNVNKEIMRVSGLSIKCADHPFHINCENKMNTETNRQSIKTECFTS